MSKWISVDDKLPEKKQEWYLISTNCDAPNEKVVTMAFYDYAASFKEAVWLTHNDGYRLDSEWECVTHWMSLPEPPKEQ